MNRQGVAKLGGRFAHIAASQAACIADDLRRFHVSLDDFNQHVQSCCPLAEGEDESVGRLALHDLVLACACSRGDRAALGAFDELCGRELESLAMKLKLDNSLRADMRQLLWQRIFVGDDRPPKILEYGGKGPIRHWFRILASRFLLNELRRTRRERLVLESDYGELCVATTGDSELMLLEQSYCQQFRHAFQAALKDLRPDQRNALRCHYILGMKVGQMAEVFGVHRATASRRLSQSREALLQYTRDRLRQALGANTDELNSVIRRVQGQSSLSVARLLEQTALADDAIAAEVDSE